MSNFSGSQVAQALQISRQYGWSPYVSHQMYYSLIGRDYEWDLVPWHSSRGVGVPLAQQ